MLRTGAGVGLGVGAMGGVGCVGGDAGVGVGAGGGTAAPGGCGGESGGDGSAGGGLFAPGPCAGGASSGGRRGEGGGSAKDGGGDDEGDGGPRTGPPTRSVGGLIVGTSGGPFASAPSALPEWAVPQMAMASGGESAPASGDARAWPTGASQGRNAPPVTCCVAAAGRNAANARSTTSVRNSLRASSMQAAPSLKLEARC